MIGLIVGCCALVLIVLCIATDINDDLFFRWRSVLTPLVLLSGFPYSLKCVKRAKIKRTINSLRRRKCWNINMIHSY